MKKIFTLLAVMMLVFAGANAQQRKSWDFSKGISEESRAALDADGAHWDKTSNGEGVTTDWTSKVNIVGNAMMGEVAVPELEGLLFGDFAATNALKYYGTKIRLQKNCTFTIEGLSAGQKIAIKAQSANTTATDRGFALSNAADAEGNSSFTILGRDAEGAAEGGLYIIEANVIADGNVTFTTGLNGAPASGIEILSIIIDEGDKNIKKWNFTWSDATKAQVLAAADWTKAENATKEYITGDEIRWNLEVNTDANNDLTAGGEAIKELKGLRHSNLAAYGYGIAFDYQTTTDGNNWGPYNAGSYLWITGANSTITVPNVKAGSTFKLGVETHKLIPAGGSDARGLQVLVGGTEVGATQKATDYTVFEYTIPEGEDEFVDVVLKATKGCHLYSIEAEVKDETIVDKNPKLGKPKFVGIPAGKINPEMGEIEFTMSFPESQNIDADVAIYANGFFGPAGLEGEEAGDYMFEDMEGTVGQGINFTMSDFGLALEENTAYEFYLTSITVDGFEALNKEAAEGEKLYGFTFETTGPGIEEPREWAFTTTVEMAEEIAASVNNNLGYWNASSKGRYSVANPITYKQLMVTEDKPLAITEGLYFSMNTANDILVGTPAHNGVDATTSAGGNNGRLQLGGGSPSLIIPQCSEGDEVTITALYASSSGSSLTIINGTCEGETSIAPLEKSAKEYKIIVTSNGDLEIKSKSAVYTKITVFPASIKKEQINYVISAVDTDEMPIKTLAEGEGLTNDKIEYFYPYYIMDEEGNVWTNGAKGAPFNGSVTLEPEVENYSVSYKKANIDGFVKGVFCAEAEDLEGATPCQAGNMAIRASMGKCAFSEVDVNICYLEPGTYMVKAMAWDSNKGGGVTRLVFTCGDQEYEVYSNGDNMSECYIAEPIIVTEETQQLVWAAGGDEKTCLDAILVYEYDVEATGINNATVNTKVANGKFLNGNAIVIVKNGVKYNALGIEVK